MKTLKFAAFIVVAATSSFFITGCDKDDDAAPTKTELLVGKNWKATSLKYEERAGSGAPFLTEDLFSDMDACSKDNILKFNNDKTYTWDEGVTKCDPTDPQVFETGVWTFANNESEITLTETGQTPQTFKLVTLNANTLAYSVSETTSDTTATLTITFNKQ